MNNNKVAFLLIAVILVWGVNWTVTKMIVSVMPPIWATAGRAIIAVLALLIIQGATRTLTLPSLKDLPVICVVAILHMTIFAVLITIGLQYISVGRSVVLGYTTPLWVAPLAWLCLGETMPLRRIIGIIIGLLGLTVILNPLSLDWSNSQALLGNGLLLLAAFFWAISILCVRAFTWHSTPFQLCLWQNMLAVTLMIPLAFYFEGPLDIKPTPNLLWALAYSGLMGTAFGFWAINTVNTHFTATTTSLALLATPMIGILSSLLMLGEKVDLPLIIAGTLIFGGIALGTINNKTYKKH